MAPRIAIVGGGPAGLTCARLLHLQGLQATVYEGEQSVQSRSQGGSLDLHADSGMRALVAAGLEEEFKARARPEGDQVRILDQDGHVWLDVAPDVKAEGAEQRPEIDRAQLRQILLESLPDGTVKWGRKLVNVVEEEKEEEGESSSSPSFAIRFEDGTKVEANLVIGADGAWSKVRPLVSTQAPSYTGITFIDCVIEDVDARFPNLATLCGHGLCFMLSPSRGLIAQRNSGGVVRIYVVVKVEEEWAKHEFADAARGGPASTREFLLRFFDGWNDGLLELIRCCDDAPIWARPIYALPADHRWSPRRGVTVLGDAAHVMSPFAGEGVNIAMLDAFQLATALAEAWRATPTVGALCGAVPAFEQAMFARAHQAASFAASNQILAFDERAPHGFLEVMAANVAGGGPPV